MSSSGNSDRPKTPEKRTSAGRAKGKPAAAESERRSRRPATSTDAGEPGILSSLPSTRPQRPSARRAAAKRAATRPREDGTPATRRSPSKTTPGKTTPGKTAPGKTAPSRRADGGRPSGKSTGGAETRRRAQPKRMAPEAAIPRQGFETEDEIEQGMPVQPPSRPELAGAVAELLGELAQTGIARGGRIFKEAFGRLPGL